MTKEKDQPEINKPGETADRDRDLLVDELGKIFLYDAKYYGLEMGLLPTNELIAVEASLLVQARTKHGAALEANPKGKNETARRVIAAIDNRLKYLNDIFGQENIREREAAGASYEELMAVLKQHLGLKRGISFQRKPIDQNFNILMPFNFSSEEVIGDILGRKIQIVNGQITPTSIFFSMGYIDADAGLAYYTYRSPNAYFGLYGCRLMIDHDNFMAMTKKLGLNLGIRLRVDDQHDGEGVRILNYSLVALYKNWIWETSTAGDTPENPFEMKTNPSFWPGSLLPESLAKSGYYKRALPPTDIVLREAT